MKYNSVVVTRRGGPQVLEVVEQELREPLPRDVRLKVLASHVSAPDVTVRYGQSPFIPKPPLTPGYAVIGEVDALGSAALGWQAGERAGALIGYGGYSEYVYLKPKELIPIPQQVDPALAIPLIMNYLVAYQVMHRRAKVTAGDTALIIGASGGIGTALLQLGWLAGLKMYGLASQGKHAVLAEYGAVPIDYRTQDFVEVIRRLEPGGVAAVFDGMAGEYVGRGLPVLKRGGRYVSYGNPLGYAQMFRLIGQVLWFSLLPNGKSAALYSTGEARLNRRPFLEDWAALFRLLEQGKIRPIIDSRYPLLEAAAANARLESGHVVGNVVLLAPECM